MKLLAISSLPIIPFPSAQAPVEVIHSMLDYTTKDLMNTTIKERDLLLKTTINPFFYGGMDYNGHSSYSDNLDALTDHYIVIYGYDLSDEFNIIFQYVETARFTQNADSAFGDNCIIVYQSGNDKMFANHWDDIPNYYVTHVRKNKG